MRSGREVLLVRHGQTHCNVGGIVANATCRGLIKVGRHQAQLARRLLAGSCARRSDHGVIG
jgi:broad specificity phosphatase PhoE